MQFGQLEAVVLTQQLARDQRRAWVVTQLAATVEMIHYADVRLQLGREIVLLPDTGDTFQIFTGTFRVLAAELIAARARVGVQIEKRLIFLFQRFNNQTLNGVLEDIGVVARVEAVAITEHG
ncbi:hypothetical protein D3C71_1310390 [compost metagenome]